MQRGHPGVAPDMPSRRVFRPTTITVEPRTKLRRDDRRNEGVALTPEREFQNWKSRRGYALPVEQSIAYTTKRGAECTQQSRRDRKGAFDRPDHEARPL